MQIFGITGVLIIAWAVWIKNERKQDYFFILGGLSLLVYSIWIRDLIFIVLQIIFISSAAVEIIKMKK